MVVTKSILNLIQQNGYLNHWPLKDIAINANSIWRQHYELSQAYDGSSG
jgi:hypothetical protein